MAADTVQFVSYGVKVQAQPSLPTSAVPSIRFKSDADSTIYRCRVLIMPYHYSTKQYSVMKYSAIQFITIQYSVMKYSAIQFNAVQCNEIQYNTIQYNTV